MANSPSLRQGLAAKVNVHLRSYTSSRGKREKSFLEGGHRVTADLGTPSPELSRRRFLAVLGLLGVATLTGCSESEPTTSTSAPLVNTGPEPIAHRVPAPAVRPDLGSAPIDVSAQVCVVGAGAAGLAAATSAARLGVQTVLLEESYKVGGNLTRGLVNLDKVGWGGQIMVGGYFNDLLQTLALEGQAVYPSEETGLSTYCDPDALERKALQLAKKAQVDIRLCSQVNGVEKEGSRIRAVWAQGQGMTLRVTADIFIDATGDGHLGYLAGHPFWLGDRDHGQIQGQTLIFYAGPVDWNQLSDFALRDGGSIDAQRLVGLRPFMARLKAQGGVLAEAQAGMLINRNLWPEMVSISASETFQNHLEPDALLSIMEVLGDQNREIHHALTVEIPGFRDSHIIRVADRPYLREGRRLIGQYQLTVDDIIASRKPADSIARGWYPLDLHVSDSPGGNQTAPFRAGEYYGIPYRCLVARDLDNLLMAGRCISVTHEALGSTRISPVSMGLGQASGMAAALCVQKKLNPGQAPVMDVQKAILAAGGLI